MARPAGVSDHEATASIEDWLDKTEFADEPSRETDPKPTDEIKPKEPEEKPEEGPVEGEEELDKLAAGDTDDKDKKKPEEGDPLINSLEGIAEYFEVKPEEVLDNLLVKRDDGSEIPVGEALTSWRESEGLLREQRGQLESEYVKLSEANTLETQKQLAKLHAITKGMVQELQSEYSDEKLQAARLEDPDQYVKLFERRNELGRLITESANAFDSYGKQTEAENASRMQNTMAEENSKLLEAKPEWKVQAVRDEAMVAGQRLLMDIGFTAKEIDSVLDHKILLLVDMAVRGNRISKEAGEKNVDDLRKRGLKRPSIGLRPKSRKDAEDPATGERDKAREQLHRTGDENLAARLIEDLL